jgi:hypothetical protein
MIVIFAAIVKDVAPLLKTIPCEYHGRKQGENESHSLELNLANINHKARLK